VMISSESDFGRVLVPVLALAQNNKKFVQNQCQKQHYIPESWPLILVFWTFYSIFVEGSRTGTVMHSGFDYGSAKPIVTVPTVPVLQH
jgi:hypothetical protein